MIPESSLWWGEDALCRYEGDPRDWDEILDVAADALDGKREPAAARRARHRRAIEVCSRCPVIQECRDDVDPERDTGIRFGVLLTGRFRRKLINHESGRKTA